jgi:hypothetical protein
MRASLACILGAVAVAAVAGCAGRSYIYRPEENATARVSGRPAAYYQVPPQAPHGHVRIATLGIVELRARDDDHDRIHAMHVRMVVSNNDDQGSWQLDTRQQIGFLDSYGQSRPAFATSNVGRPPVIDVAVRGSATVDLYYPLPDEMQKASKVPHFEVLWSVQTPEGAVAQRTSFERLEIEPVPTTGYYAGAFWGPGWYDPFWPEYGFYGAVVLPPAYYERPVVSGRRPPPAVRIR